MRRKYELELLDRAVSAVKDAGVSYRGAAKTYGVPYKTIRDHVLGVSTSTKRGPKTVLPQKMEKDLCEAIVEMRVMGHGVRRQDVMNLAADVAEKCDGPGFKKLCPTSKWFRGFRKRHNLALRQPMNISVNRMSMETLEVKTEFYDRVEETYNQLIARGLKPHMIYNMDESGMCLVAKSGKILAEKGTKKVRIRKGGERGENITVVACVNASGSHIIPPTIIFRGKSLNEDLTKGGIEGSVYAHSPRSFIDSELFTEYFERWRQSIPPARPALLFYDGHASHISNTVIQAARADDIHIFCFPPHTTHLYQPLDRVFGSLKTAFEHSCQVKMRKNKRKSLNRYDFNSVFAPAWFKSMTPANIQSGFRQCGLWPLDRNIVVLPCEENNQAEEGS